MSFFITIKSFIFSLVGMTFILFIPAVFFSIKHSVLFNPFLITFIIYLFISIFGIILLETKKVAIKNIHDIVSFVLCFWLFSAILASVPLILSGYNISFSFFQASLAITTTTIDLINQETLAFSPLLLFKTFLSWYGGIITITSIAIIWHKLNIVNYTNYIDQNNNIENNNSDIIKNIFTIFKYFLFTYIFITILIFAVQFLMINDWKSNFINALLISSSGGLVINAINFTSWQSLFFGVLLLIGGLNLIDISTKNFGFENKVFIILVISLTLIYFFTKTFLLKINYPISLYQHNIFKHFFAISSLITTNGNLFDIKIHTAFALCCALIGGVSFSAAGGIGIYRWLQIIKNIFININNLTVPYVIDKTPKAFHLIIIYFIVFAITIGISIIVISFFNVALEESVILTVSILTNSGPLYHSLTGKTLNILPDNLFYFLSILSIIGRIEIAASLVFISKTFWIK